MSEQREIPRLVRLLTLVISAVVLLSAAAGAGLAVLMPMLVEGQRTALALFGFEVVVGVGAVLGVLVGRGAFREAPGMALLCIGGTILAGSVLGWQGAGRQLAGVSLTPVMGLRVLAGLAMMAAGGLVVLGREPSSWRPALVGCALGVPVVAALGVMVHPRGRGLVLGVLGDDIMVQAGAAAAVLMVFGGLLAASVHMVMGAFDRAVGD